MGIGTGTEIETGIGIGTGRSCYRDKGRDRQRDRKRDMGRDRDGGKDRGYDGSRNRGFGFLSFPFPACPERVRWELPWGEGGTPSPSLARDPPPSSPPPSAPRAPTLLDPRSPSPAAGSPLPFSVPAHTGGACGAAAPRPVLHPRRCLPHPVRDPACPREPPSNPGSAIPRIPGGVTCFRQRSRHWRVTGSGRVTGQRIQFTWSLTHPI